MFLSTPSMSSRIQLNFELSLESFFSSLKSNILFIWIPKCAGTSIYSSLRPAGMVKLKHYSHAKRHFWNAGRVTFGHMSIPDLINCGIVSRKFLDDSFVFAICRNPYDRACSLFNYFIKDGRFKKYRKEPNFDEFLQTLAQENYHKIGLYNGIGYSQCNPQIEWLRDVPIDKIYRIEDLSCFVSDFEDLLKINSLPITNKSNASSQSKLTKNQIHLINSIYSEDFDLLDYRKK